MVKLNDCFHLIYFLSNLQVVKKMQRLVSVGINLISRHKEFKYHGIAVKRVKIHLMRQVLGRFG